MDMPSRIEIRRWLVENTREQILQFLDDIKQEHGPLNEQDVRDMLNAERAGPRVDSPAEASLLTEHERRKAEITNDIKSQNKLYGGKP